MPTGRRLLLLLLLISEMTVSQLSSDGNPLGTITPAIIIIHFASAAVL